MKRSITTRLLGLALAGGLLLSVSGCGTNVRAENLMDGVKAHALSADTAQTDAQTAAIADFSVTLFKDSVGSDENTLISPISLLYAMGMTANGARGETLSQMKKVFGLSDEELNNYLGAYIKNLPSGDKYRVSLANSIWLNDRSGLTVEKDFLQTNADHYGAAVYKTAFDGAALRDINSWVSENTGGMIKKILDEIPADAVMYLINALAFDAEWETVYKDTQVRDGSFTTEAGEARDAKMMYSTEHMYLDDGKATGFLKYYADRKYAFAAMLPNDGVRISDYVSSLTGEALMNTLANARNEEIKTALPKFESEYSADMSDILKAMGMTDAFDGTKADFTGLGKLKDGNIAISRILHKTHIAVDERGTKAGAVTAVEMTGTAMPMEKPKTVYLDRPFVYMLIDCGTNLPIFIGTMTDTGK